MPRDSHWSRRALLLGGAAAAVGGAASLAAATPAAATTGAMQFGAANLAGTDATSLTSSHGTAAFSVFNNGSGISMRAISTTGAALLTSSSQGPAIYMSSSRDVLPTAGAFTRGSLLTLNDGSLWYCAVSGTPGEWRMIASPSSAGAFVPITPARVHDSRYYPMPIFLGPDESRAEVDPNLLPLPKIPQPLSAGGSRIISVADSYTPGTNTVAISDVVPAGARAVAVNLTIVKPTAGGYMFLAPGDAAAITGSSINWTAANAMIANGLIVALDDNRQLKAFLQLSGGAGTSHFIVDVSGYWLGG